MLTGPQRKFAAAYVIEQNGKAAYLVAYPSSSPAAAESGASRLLRSAKVQEEIERIRDKADEKAGSAVLTLAEKRLFLARVVRMGGAAIDEKEDADLINGVKFDRHGRRMLDLPDKLRALELDSKLAGELAGDKAAEKQAGALGEIAEALDFLKTITHGRISKT